MVEYLQIHNKQYLDILNPKYSIIALSTPHVWPHSLYLVSEMFNIIIIFAYINVVNLFQGNLHCDSKNYFFLFYSFDHEKLCKANETGFMCEAYEVGISAKPTK